MNATHSRPSQAQRVIDYIEENGSITQIEALAELGVMRLASRVSELKKQGHLITSEIVTVTNRYGEKCRVKKYSLGSAKNG
jgi:hypothetical protein